MNIPQYKEALLNNKLERETLSQQLWEYQLSHNARLASFASPLDLEGPFFFPIEFFKAFSLKTGGDWQAEQVFHSSGTTGQVPSRHFVKKIDWYEQVVLAGFYQFFPQQSYRILALLPSYLERDNSSLVYMVKTWMDHFGLPGSGFYLYNFDALEQAIGEGNDADEPILLIGVAFALLDFAKQSDVSLKKDAWVIETGGMKGRGEELTRPELHRRLCEGLGVQRVVSEYGMTELMSQAYAIEQGRFRSPPWMQVYIVDVNLPTRRLENGHRGRIGIVDLANIDSCGFILTDDLGIMHEDGTFEVLGRVDMAELRGCNLLYE